MAGYLSVHRAKCLRLFLNICFLFLICLATHLCSLNSDFLNHSKRSNSIVKYYQILDSDIGCKGLNRYHDKQAKCSYVKSHSGCQPGGYISYLQLFYCNFSPVLGYTLFILWLVLLFYLLGDTAANYFCSSLEGLSRILKLSPTIAGVTLLSLGNGAPDLFASIASFMGDNTDDVGLNSILGGAFFVSSTVVGIISICIRHSRVSIDKSSFRRNVLFLLLSLLCLLVIIIFGKINLWGAISFLSLYVVYVFWVSTSELGSEVRAVEANTAGPPILPQSRTFLGDVREENSVLKVPLLGFMVDDKPISIEQSAELHVGEPKGGKRCFNIEASLICCRFGKLILCILELPLYLPRRLTIPVISEERWSKPCAVISVTVAPVLMAAIWNSEGLNLPMVYAVGGSVGTILGVLALLTTVSSDPPRKCLFPWLAGGFLMSITWTYILAEELVSLLVALGLVLGISPSILGLTVLAWGNSIGDLVANVTMATNGGPDGVEVAISGCYAGPIFNTVVGLGLSFTFASWTVYPSSYLLPKDPLIYGTVGFVMGGLLWALVVLPHNNMKLDVSLGLGLLAIYLCFLSLKMSTTLWPTIAV